MTAVEEFGIVAVESQAAGRPVIARRGGGALETVVEGVTGCFWSGGPRELAAAVLAFDDAGDRPAGVRRQRRAVRRGRVPPPDARRGRRRRVAERGRAARRRASASRCATAAARRAAPLTGRDTGSVRAGVMRAGVLTVARAVLLAGADRARVLRRRLLRRGAGLGGLVAGCWSPSRSRSSPARCRAAARVWLALGGLALLARLDAALDHVGADRGRRLPRRPARRCCTLGALLAATLLLRAPAARRWVEPALAAGAVIVIGYGMSERLLPGRAALRPLGQRPGPARAAADLLERDGGARGARVRAVRRARRRPRRARRGCESAAAAAAAPLGMGLYMSFSRGALFACARRAGRAVVVIVRRREQLWARAPRVCFGGARPRSRRRRSRASPG